MNIVLASSQRRELAQRASIKHKSQAAKTDLQSIGVREELVQTFKAIATHNSLFFYRTPT